MLRVTDDAAAMINDLLQDEHLPDGAGLRIAQRDDHPALAMRMADAPGPHDLVLHEHDATVFLGPVASERLTGHTLGALTGETGAAFFLEP